MRVTRRGWGVVLAGLLLVIGGLLLQRPLLLVGAGVTGAWLLAAAARYVWQLERTVDEIDIDQSPESERVATDRPISVTLSGSLGQPASLELDIESQPPVSTSIDAPQHLSIDISIGQTAATTIYQAAWPHAGSVRFDPPIATATDSLGLFRTRFAAGPTPSISVNPRTPREMHVGAGGDPIAAAYGEHRTGRHGAGLEPAEIREYQPGDAAAQIDWKATARLARPHVREFEIQTTRRTMLVLDHRHHLAAGPAGETQLDYLREVALAVLEEADAMDDPVGCATVGDEGLTGRWLPETSGPQFERIAGHLSRLEPTEAPTTDGPSHTRYPADARRDAAALRGDESPFASTLEPYFHATTAYVRRVSGHPLYETVRSLKAELEGPAWIVLFTGDADQPMLRQTVKAAQRGEGRISLFLAPSGLFESVRLADYEQAYDRYVEFEEFRRELDRLQRVQAYEVAPGDRLDAVLSAGRRRRAAAGGS